jgi:hypothetical protein
MALQDYMRIVLIAKTLCAWIAGGLLLAKLTR